MRQEFTDAEKGIESRDDKITEAPKPTKVEAHCISMNILISQIYCDDTIARLVLAIFNKINSASESITRSNKVHPTH